MNYFLLKATGTLSVIVCLGLSSITAFAQIRQAGQISQSASPTTPLKPISKPATQLTDWKTFRFAESHFSIAFPQKPEIIREQGKEGGIVYTYKVERDDDFYLISYAEIPGLDKIPRNDVLDTLEKQSSAFVKSLGGKLTRNQAISQDKNPGQVFDFLIQSGAIKLTGKGQIQVNGDRLYTLASIGKSQDLSRFLDSFKLN
jgi:hypothetical protein